MEPEASPDGTLARALSNKLLLACPWIFVYKPWFVWTVNRPKCQSEYTFPLLGQKKKKEKGKKMTKIQPETHPDLNLLQPVSFPLKPVSDCWLLISSTGGLED